MQLFLGDSFIVLLELIGCFALVCILAAMGRWFKFEFIRGKNDGRH